MTRFQKTVYWTVTFSVFGYMGINMPIIEASGPLLAQVPQTEVKVVADSLKAETANQLLVFRTGHLTVMNPDGENEKKVSGEGETYYPLAARLSPDGKRLAVFQAVEAVEIAAGADTVQLAKVTNKLFVRGLDEKHRGADMGVSCRTCAWSPNSAEIAFTEVKAGRHWIVNLKSREKKPLDLPKTHTIIDWSRDGAFFLTTDVGDPVAAGGNLPNGRLYLMNRDGTPNQVLTGMEPGWPGGPFGRLSPDGKQVLYIRMAPRDDDPAQTRYELIVLDIETAKSTNVAVTLPDGTIGGLCWSPDGRQIAYTWQERHKGKAEELIDKETTSHLVVCDPDGRNRSTIAIEKAAGQWITTLGQVDWR
jgi:Tol biopolymer transport system component